MPIKRLSGAALGATIAVSVAFTAGGPPAAARAKTLLFTWSETGTGAIDLSFEQSSDPTPIFFEPGILTWAPVSDWMGTIGPFSYIVWFHESAGVGMFFTPDQAVAAAGPQVYTGPESAPVFAPGTFAGVNATDGLFGTLTVTAVPEPSTWAMALLGLGGLGFLGYRKGQAASA